MWAATRAELAPAALREAALGQAIVQRSARYTTDRDTLASPRPDGDGDLAARALFFTVADAAKIWIPLGELLGRGLIPTGAPLRVVDLGAGAGAMSLGLAGFLARHMPSVRAEILAIDRDRRALAILAAAAAKLAPPLAGTVAVSTRVATLGGAVSGPADLVLAGSVLNELSPAAALDLVRAAMDALTPDGAVILIEPALRQVARRLHQLRDTVIAEGIAAVFAPCTRTVAPCPALADDRDWCHEDRPADLPPQLSRLARRTNLRTGGLKFSYLVLRRA
ncbi:MAG TPA: small ribosomal subunit Rsm22 family protein, partial [Kofleriaceae bacterium]|nr:small ribosomal subunit Rsm22 family protein [Kofleriaceae bacterium]